MNEPNDSLKADQNKLENFLKKYVQVKDAIITINPIKEGKMDALIFSTNDKTAKEEKVIVSREAALLVHPFRDGSKDKEPKQSFGLPEKGAAIMHVTGDPEGFGFAMQSSPPPETKQSESPAKPPIAEISPLPPKTPMNVPVQKGGGTSSPPR